MVANTGTHSVVSWYTGTMFLSLLSWYTGTMFLSLVSWYTETMFLSLVLWYNRDNVLIPGVVIHVMSWLNERKSDSLP